MAIELFPYQTEAIKDLPKNVVMAMDVGLGKGQMALEHYKRHNPSGQLIVIAPASKVRTKDWDREIAMAGLPEAPVMSYERFSKVAKTIDPTDLTIIFDEAHYLCNATSLRAKAAIYVATRSVQWIGLTATPLPNGWRSAATYSILTGLSRNKTSFFNRFVITDRSRGFPLILGYREESALEGWWSQVSRPLKRTGNLVLPSVMIPVEPKMDSNEKRAYKIASKDRIGPGGEMLDSPGKLFATLRQIPTLTRVTELERLLDTTDEHIVVFYNYNSERDALLLMLEHSHSDRVVYEQSGHVSHLPERDEWDKLKPSVTLAQYQSAAQAIELTYASITVYLSPPTSYANYEQSKGRTRRNGQERTTLFYHIAVEGSIDRHIWKIIKGKKVFSDVLMRSILKDEGVNL